VTVGVLLLAYGGPDSLADIPAYLQNVRGGRPTPARLVEVITERYRRIGGRSPLLDITRSTAEKLQTRLETPVYVGMRHWHPYIGDVVPKIIADGVAQLVVICMAPHYSRLSIGAYRAKLDAALATASRRPSVDFVENWHTQPTYLAGIADNVRATLAHFPQAVRDCVKVIFTAHSLPESILAEGDPYDDQCRETAQLLAVALALPDDRWTLAYQSAPKTGMPWLVPKVEDLIPTLGQAGERHILIAPVGFVADHVEVQYDIDIGARGIAEQLGVQLERTPMLNDSAAMIVALEEIARARLRKIKSVDLPLAPVE
jgi:protoporphyrin/coproporphyrin ferrochelatase